MSRTPKALNKSSRMNPGIDKFELSPQIIHRENYDIKKSYDWRHHLDTVKSVSVEKYASAPLQAVFHHLRAGLKVEVPNKEYWKTSRAIGGIYWVAYVLKVVGYKALVRYEGYEDSNNTADFWINLCSSDLHPVGWCASVSRPLVPPTAVSSSQTDWKGFLVKRLTGARTLPQDFQDKVERTLADCPFKKGMRLEIIDRSKPEQLRVGLVDQIIANRLFIVPSTNDTPSQTAQEPVEEPVDFWCSTGSALIYPVGFAVSTGYPILCTEEYTQHCENIIKDDNKRQASGMDARWGMFDLTPKCVRPGEMIAELPSSENGDNANESFVPKDPGPIENHFNSNRSKQEWEVGMKLEILDPVEMNAFYVVTVAEILKGGYLKLTLDGSEPDHFLFSEDSPYLFPAGFCDENSIVMEAIKDSKCEFNWDDYLKQTQSLAAPSILFDHDKHEHSFQIGCKLEAVDSLEPKLICVATLVDKKGSRLLKLRYDGWEEDYDQWQDYRSPDIYPIGWAEMVGYQLEPPKDQIMIEENAAAAKRKSGVASVGTKKPRKEETA